MLGCSQESVRQGLFPKGIANLAGEIAYSHRAGCEQIKSKQGSMRVKTQGTDPMWGHDI